jgi:type IX secretion system PorP/SprF family membrane protein
MKTKKSILTIFCQAVLIVLAQEVIAQDIHVSQYEASPILLNPALTGMQKDMKYRFVHQYRNQWDAITRKSYMSSALAYDMPYEQKWGAGAYILNDNSSRTYNSFSFALSGSHDITIPNQDKHHLCVGLQVGIILKTLKQSRYTFDEQYSQGGFDSQLPSGENFEKDKRFLPEINFGFAYYNTDESKKYRPYGGIAISHITNPKSNFLAEGETSRLPLKYLLYGGSKLVINDKFQLDPNLMVMKQKNAWELNIGTKAYYFMEGADFVMIGGLNYRLKDAVIGQFGIFYKNFIYRISYDMNVSKLRIYSNYKGGLEFSVTFFKRIGGGKKSLSGY